MTTKNTPASTDDPGKARPSSPKDLPWWEGNQVLAGHLPPPEPSSREIWAAMLVIVVIVLLLTIFVIPVLTMVL